MPAGSSGGSLSLLEAVGRVQQFGFAGVADQLQAHGHAAVAEACRQAETG